MDRSVFSVESLVPNSPPAIAALIIKSKGMFPCHLKILVRNINASTSTQKLLYSGTEVVREYFFYSCVWSSPQIF